MAFRDSSSLDITSCIKHILTHLERDISFLTSEDVSTLLDNEMAIVDTPPPTRKGMAGYPSRPLYREIGNVVQIWFDTGLVFYHNPCATNQLTYHHFTCRFVTIHVLPISIPVIIEPLSFPRNCPLVDLPTFELLDEKDYVAQRAETISSLTPQLKRLKSLFTCWSDDEIAHTVLHVLQCLGKRGLLDLIGMRKTVGSSELWPPSRQLLRQTFQQCNSPESDSILTVGARALAKHCHRDQSLTWWGVSSGNETAKNNHALSVMEKILDGAVWINIHQLPNEVFVVEARQENGYGVRWTADGTQFRGFLEPQMVDGHEMHWRH